MEFEIKKLTPELCDDWLGYFDGIAFGDHGEWAFCYCLEGHMTRQENDDLKDHTARRECAKKMIHDGKMQGYLVYDGDKVIGWCNVNNRENYPYIGELFEHADYHPEKQRTKSVFCFLIAAEYRGQGIAEAILNRVCEDAKADGYESVEAYPFSDAAMEFQFHGTTKMYLRNGFEKIADFQFIDVMSKKLVS